MTHNQIDRNRDELKIYKENWIKIDKMMSDRIEVLKKLFPYEWWEISIKDPYYKHLCRIMTDLKIWKRRLKIKEILEEIR